MLSLVATKVVIRGNKRMGSTRAGVPGQQIVILRYLRTCPQKTFNSACLPNCTAAIPTFRGEGQLFGKCSLQMISLESLYSHYPTTFLKRPSHVRAVPMSTAAQGRQAPGISEPRRSQSNRARQSSKSLDTLVTIYIHIMPL